MDIIARRLAWHGTAWHGRPLSRTELYNTVPMLSLGTGGAVLPFLWIGSSFGSLPDLSTAIAPQQPEAYAFYSGC